MNAATTMNLDAEGSLLGAMLSNDEATSKGVAMRLGDDFCYESNRGIYDAMVALHAAGRPVDVVTVATQLHADADLKARLHTLADACPAAAHVVAYGEAMRQAADHRRLRAALDQMKLDAQANGRTPAELHRHFGEILAEAAPAEADGASSQVPVYSGVDLASMKIVEPEPIVEGIAYVACSTYLMGKNKGGGKTTLMADVSESLTTGRGSWCGRQTKPSPVLYSQSSRRSHSTHSAPAPACWTCPTSASSTTPTSCDAA